MGVYRGDNLVWVQQAIQSILSQTYSAFVFVIIIDGEIPISLRHALTNAAKQDNRIVLAQNLNNIGLAASMNAIIEWVLPYSPQYFVRMDADDIAMPSRLEKQIHYLEQHQHVAVLGSGLVEIDEDGNKIGTRKMPASHKQILKMLPRRCAMNHPTVTMRFDIFRDGYRYDASSRNTEDYFLWITLAHDGYVFRNLKDELLEFRRGSHFYQRRGFSKSTNEFRARWRAMRKLNGLTLHNLVYASFVLVLRMMPASIVKMAYDIDRHLLERFIKH